MKRLRNISNHLYWSLGLFSRLGRSTLDQTWGLLPSHLVTLMLVLVLGVGGGCGGNTRGTGGVRISGQVQNSNTNEALARVTVQDPRTASSDITDELGDFEFRTERHGSKIRLILERDGVSGSITLAGLTAETTEISVVLGFDPVDGSVSIINIDIGDGSAAGGSTPSSSPDEGTPDGSSDREIPSDDTDPSSDEPITPTPPPGNPEDPPAATPTPTPNTPADEPTPTLPPGNPENPPRATPTPTPNSPADEPPPPPPPPGNPDVTPTATSTPTPNPPADEPTPPPPPPGNPDVTPTATPTPTPDSPPDDPDSDNPPPDPVVVPPPELDALPQLVNTAELSVSGSKAAGTGILLDGTILIPVSDALIWQTSITLGEEGENVLRFLAQDGASNQSNTVTATVVLDTLAPQATIAVDNLSQTSAEISIRSSEPVTLSGYYVRQGDSSRVALFNSQLQNDHLFTPSSLLPSSTYTVSVQISDAATNTTALSATFTTLDVPLPEPVVVWSSGEHNIIVRSQKPQPTGATLQQSPLQDKLLALSLNEPGKLAYDPLADKFYFSQPRSLLRVNPDWSDLEFVLGTDFSDPSGVPAFTDISGGFAVHPLTQQIYWRSRLQDGAIKRADSNGDNVETILVPEYGQAGDLVIDRQLGKLYWYNNKTLLYNTTFDEPTTIYRANLDGSDTEEFISGLGDLTALFLDETRRYLYWSAQGTGGGIHRISLDGGTVQHLVSSAEAKYALDLEVESSTGRVYWIGADSNLRTTLNPLSDLYCVDVEGAVIEHLLTSPPPAWEDQKGTRFSKLAIDETRGKVYLWIARGKVFTATLDGSAFEEISNNMVSDSDIIGMTVDLENSMLYWTINYKIARSNLDGSGAVFFLSGLDPALPPEQQWTVDTNGITIDKTTGRLYWNAQIGQLGATGVMSANVDGSNLTIVFSDPLGQRFAGLFFDPDTTSLYGNHGDSIVRIDPTTSQEDVLVPGTGRLTDLAYDPVDQVFFWINETTLDIERASLAGGQVEVIVSGLSAPWSLEFEPQTRKLYWIDRGTKKVQRANVDGSGLEDYTETNLVSNGDIVVYVE